MTNPKRNFYTKHVLVRVTPEMKKLMQKHKEIAWSEVIRRYITNYLLLVLKEEKRK